MILRAALAFCLLLAFAFALPERAEAADYYDSLYVNSLNMTDEDVEEAFGAEERPFEVEQKEPTLEEKNELSPSYVVRDYNHREQVIVGGVVMLCVAVAMVLMNNYNPSR